MSLSLHTIKPAVGARPKKTRVGRGNASGRGTTAGRGTKGQRARTGGRKGLKLKGLRQMLLSFPKSRGFKSDFPVVTAVPLDRIVAKFEDGARVDMAALKKAHLIPNRAQLAKVIGGGDAVKKLNFIGIRSTTSVKAAIEKAGGSFAEEAPKGNKK